MSSVLLWLNVWVAFGIAAVLVGAGAYVVIVWGSNPLNPLSKSLRFVGFALIAAGIILGSHADGERVGGASCEAAWRSANYQAKLDKAAQEAAAQRTAAQTAEAQAAELEAANADLQKTVDNYEKLLSAQTPSGPAEKTGLAPLAPITVACALNADDVRELRSIAGASASGDSHPKRLRAKRARRSGT